MRTRQAQRASIICLFVAVIFAGVTTFVICRGRTHTHVHAHIVWIWTAAVVCVIAEVTMYRSRIALANLSPAFAGKSALRLLRKSAALHYLSASVSMLVVSAFSLSLIFEKGARWPLLLGAAFVLAFGSSIYLFRNARKAGFSTRAAIKRVAGMRPGA